MLRRHAVRYQLWAEASRRQTLSPANAGRARFGHRLAAHAFPGQGAVFIVRQNLAGIDRARVPDVSVRAVVVDAGGDVGGLRDCRLKHAASGGSDPRRRKWLAGGYLQAGRDRAAGGRCLGGSAGVCCDQSQCAQDDCRELRFADDLSASAVALVEDGGARDVVATAALVLRR